MQHFSNVHCGGVTPAVKWTRRLVHPMRVSAVSILARDDDTVSIAVVLIMAVGRGRDGGYPAVCRLAASTDGTTAQYV